ncbi:unnamed protein product, partial [Acanthocheilonema viteae]
KFVAMKNALIAFLTLLFAFSMLIAVVLLVRSHTKDSNDAMKTEASETESGEMESGEMGSNGTEFGEIESNADDSLDANNNNLDCPEVASNNTSANGGFIPHFFLRHTVDTMPPAQREILPSIPLRRRGMTQDRLISQIPPSDGELISDTMIVPSNSLRNRGMTPQFFLNYRHINNGTLPKLGRKLSSVQLRQHGMARN